MKPKREKSSVKSHESASKVEITFIVREDDHAGGYTARAHWPAGNRDIFTAGDTRDDLVRNIREALEATFEPEEAVPDLIHLHFVRDEVIAR